MHIQERNNTTLTTCTKMTEEVDRRHGMNGNSSSKGVSDSNSVHSSAPPTSAGGRLKFFKDGKLLLELEQSREGERLGWVSVPRKTFWPPPPAAPSTPSTLSARQERATSLSVSDDNSSVQSSPWQRDHCWKQASPRRGLSRELGLLYVRPASLPVRALRCPEARRKRRRPHDPAPVPAPAPANGQASPEEAHFRPSADKPTAQGKFKFLRNKGEAVPEHAPLRVYKKSGKRAPRREMSKIIDSLKEKLPPQFTPVNAKISALNCKQDHLNVSPRKRILREMERVSLEDPANKRSRARRTPPTQPPLPGPSCAPDPARLYNGTSRAPPPSKPVSSYSIHSLLSMPEDGAPAVSPEGSSSRKPHAYSSAKSESPVGAQSPDSHSSRRPAAHASPLGAQSPDSQSLGPQAAYGYASSPDPSPSPEYRRGGWGALRPAFAHDYYYGEGYGLAGYPGAYLPAPYLGYPTRMPVWPTFPSHYPPNHWGPLPPPLLNNHTPKEDTSSDLPLNLSKH